MIMRPIVFVLLSGMACLGDTTYFDAKVAAVGESFHAARTNDDWQAGTLSSLLAQAEGEFAAIGPRELRRRKADDYYRRLVDMRFGLEKDRFRIPTNRIANCVNACTQVCQSVVNCCIAAGTNDCRMAVIVECNEIWFLYGMGECYAKSNRPFAASLFMAAYSNAVVAACSEQGHPKRVLDEVWRTRLNPESEENKAGYRKAMHELLRPMLRTGVRPSWLDSYK